jgi:hypothetical protein
VGSKTGAESSSAAAEFNGFTSDGQHLKMKMFRKHREDKGKHGSGNGNHRTDTCALTAELHTLRCAFIEECRQAP